MKILLFVIFEVCEILAQKDIVFILDRSKSVTDKDFDLAVDFVHSTVERLDIGPKNDLVSVITYSDDIKEEFDLNNHTEKTSLLAAIKRIKLEKAGGGTKTHDALKYARINSLDKSHGARKDASSLVILMTDGVSYVPYAIRESSKLKNLGVAVFAIGIGSAVADGLEELEAISSDPDTVYMYTVGNFSMLQEIVPTLVEELKKDFTSKPIVKEEYDTTLIVIIVVVIVICILLVSLMIYFVQKRLHKKEIEKIRKNTICEKCQFEEHYKHKISLTSRGSETSPCPPSLTDTTTDTELNGKEKESEIIVVSNPGEKTVKRKSKSKSRASRSSIHPKTIEVKSKENDTDEIDSGIVIQTKDEKAVKGEVQSDTNTETERNRKQSTESCTSRSGKEASISDREKKLSSRSVVSEVSVAGLKKTPYVQTVVEIDKYLQKEKTEQKPLSSRSVSSNTTKSSYLSTDRLSDVNMTFQESPRKIEATSKARSDLKVPSIPPWETSVTPRETKGKLSTGSGAVFNFVDNGYLV